MPYVCPDENCFASLDPESLVCGEVRFFIEHAQYTLNDHLECAAKLTKDSFVNEENAWEYTFDEYFLWMEDAGEIIDFLKDIGFTYLSGITYDTDDFTLWELKIFHKHIGGEPRFSLTFLEDELTDCIQFIVDNSMSFPEERVMGQIIRGNNIEALDILLKANYIRNNCIERYLSYLSENNTNEFIVKFLDLLDIEDIDERRKWIK
jgi:hypothetical protein